MYEPIGPIRPLLRRVPRGIRRPAILAGVPLHAAPRGGHLSLVLRLLQQPQTEALVVVERRLLLLEIRRVVVRTNTVHLLAISLRCLLILIGVAWVGLTCHVRWWGFVVAASVLRVRIVRTVLHVAIGWVRVRMVG